MEGKELETQGRGNPSLGFATKEGLAKVQAKSEARESHFMLSRV
jgi:hypothetical protein